MNIRRLLMRTLAAAWVLALCAGPVDANMMVQNTVTGLVTLAPSGGEIAVDGRRYRISPQSAAAVEVASVHAGDRVELVLDGPPTAESTEVVEIHASSNTGR